MTISHKMMPRPTGRGIDLAVEVLSAYLNPTEHVRRLQDVVRETDHPSTIAYD